MFSEAYKSYVLGALTLVYSLNFLDRGLIVLLLQPIKEDLHLSDTQLGFLTGIAFALFYATLGLPIARWADRGNRVTITSVAISLWGVTVMLCLFVGNFVQLVVARVAAAVGEAGCMPPTYSLVGDYFPKPAERTRAVAIYMLAGPIASLVSFMAGGWLNERYSWRLTFFVMGIPALLVALLVKTTVVEPRTRADRSQSPQRQLPRLASVLGTLWAQRSTRHLSMAIILLFTLGYGLGPWYGAFMMRSHAMHTAELGIWLGLIFGVSGFVGAARRLRGRALFCRGRTRTDAPDCSDGGLAAALLRRISVVTAKGAGPARTHPLGGGVQLLLRPGVCVAAKTGGG
jgi:MFS family permease